MGNIYGRVYLGNASRLDIKDVTYGEGASKYLISNGTLHVFNGLEKRLPMYDENTYIKSTEVAQTVSSKQFMSSFEALKNGWSFVETLTL